jgi:hypothetical protein
MVDPPGAATFRTPAEAYDGHIGRYSRELAGAVPTRAAGACRACGSRSRRRTPCRSRTLWDAAVALDPSAADRDEGRCMPFCTADELGELWSTAGLADVRVRPVVVAAGYDDFEDLWQPLELGVAPSGAYASSLPAERRTALKAELRRRLGVGDAPFRLTARAWIATGQVPR